MLGTNRVLFAVALGTTIALGCGGGANTTGTTGTGGRGGEMRKNAPVP